MNLFRNLTIKERFKDDYIEDEYRCSRVSKVLSYDEEKKYFLMADKTIGFVVDCTPLPGGDSKDQERINSLLNSSFPKGLMISIMWIRSPDILKDLSEMANLRRHHTIKDPTMHDFIHDRTQFYKKASCKPINHRIGTRVFDTRLIFTIKIGIENPRPSLNEIVELETLRQKILGGMETIGFNPRLLNAYDYLRLINPIVNQAESASWRSGSVEYDEGRPICDQVFDYNNDIEVEKGHLRIGEKYIRTLSAKRLPKGFYFGNALAFAGDLRGSNNNIKSNYAIVCNITYLDAEKDRHSIENKRMFAVNQAKGRLNEMVPILSEKKQGFDTIYESLSEGFRPVKMTYSLTLWADDLETLNSETTVAATLWREHRFDLMEDTFIQLPLLINNLPLGADVRSTKELFRYKTMTIGQSTVLLPLFAEWKGTGTPHVNLISRNGQLMSFSMHDSGTNKNMLVCATSGGGKSFFTNELIMSYLSAGAKVWVIDVGRSYEKLCETIGGQFIHFGSDSNVCVNPFPIVVSLDGHTSTRTKYLTEREKHALQDDEIKDDGEEDALVGLISVMCAETEKLSSFQISKIKQTLSSLWSEHDRHLLPGMIADKLKEDPDQRIRDLGEQMYAFTEKGLYGRFFNGENNIDLQNSLTVLELEELKSRTHLQKVILFQLIYQIQQEVYLGDRSRPKVVIIDESWDLIVNGGPEVQAFIEHAYRRFRKYGASVLLVSQSIMDMYKSPVGDAILDNTATIGLFRHKDEAVENLKSQKKLVMPDAAYNLLRTVHTSPPYYSEMFIKGETGIGVGRLVVSEYSKLLYSTDPNDLGAIQRFRDKGLSVADSINAVLTDRGVISSDMRDAI